MKKRFPAMILALALCLGLCAVPAFAADSDFTIEDGVLTKYNGSGGDVTIPSGVTEIGKSVFSNCSSLTSVTIPDGVTTIGNLAFFGCDKLTSVTIPDSVTKIGGGAFAVCTSLTSVTIPDSVTAIKSSTFFRCTGLTSITIPSSVTAIEKEAFKNCTSLTSVTIPSSVTTIGDGAFKECTSLTICGYEDSAAQRYAKENDVPFDSLGTAPAPAVSFIDVAEDAWYAAPVAWAVENKITTGTGNNSFSPATDCTHIQILTFLSRAAGNTDAAELDWAEEQAAVIKWAREKGMVGEKFDSGKPCTRAEAVNYIWQAKGRPSAEASSFTDMEGYENYAKAVDWAVEKKVTDGTNAEGTTFSPDQICSRAHIATFLYRAYNN